MPHTRVARILRGSGICLWLSRFAIANVSLLMLAAGARAEDACSASTTAAATACDQQAQFHYWLEEGTCENASGPTVQAKCEGAAQHRLAEARNYCRAQADARTHVCDVIGQDPYDPPIRPSDFTNKIDNRLMPLKPGTIYTYSIPDGVDVLEVLTETRTILGVQCVVVHDTSTVNGKVEEDTFDYFAQDRAGNVWYFGEATEQFDESGRITGLLGSWIGGEAGAKPGIVMEASPKVGDAYRQEFLLGSAEDSAKVVNQNQFAKVAYSPRPYHNALVINEFTGAEPGASEDKYYVKDIGNILTIDRVTGERDELLSITHR